MTINLAGFESAVKLAALNAKQLEQLPRTLETTTAEITEKTAQSLLELAPQNYVDFFKKLPQQAQITTLQNLPPQDSKLIYELLPYDTKISIHPSLGTDMHQALNSTTKVSENTPLGLEAKEGIVKKYLQQGIEEQNAYLKTRQGAKPSSIWEDPNLQLQGKIGLQALLKEDSIRKNPSFDSLVTARLEQLVKSNPNRTKADLTAQAERDILERWDSIETTVQMNAKVPPKLTPEQEAKRYTDEYQRYIDRLPEGDVPNVPQQLNIPKLEQELKLYQSNTNNYAKVDGLSVDERTDRIAEIHDILESHRRMEASKPFGAKPIGEKDYQKLYQDSLGQVFGDPS